MEIINKKKGPEIIIIIIIRYWSLKKRIEVLLDELKRSF